MTSGFVLLDLSWARLGDVIGRWNSLRDSAFRPDHETVSRSEQLGAAPERFNP